jgi:SAM-dependent methyltransferase
MRTTTAYRGLHLDAELLRDCSTTCPVCGSPERRAPVLVLQTDPVVTLLRCPSCGGASASHMPIAGYLRDFYRDHRRGREHGVTFQAPRRFGRRLATALAPRLGGGDLRVLDFGGGDGTLAVSTARCLQRFGAVDRVEIVVVDVAPPADRGTKDQSVTWRPTLDDASGTYSLVLASAVLEHIPDLRQTLAQLFARVAPGGFLYVRTPYVVPLAHWLPRVDFAFPAHVHDLGSDFWARLRRVFRLPAECLLSRPSPVAASWRREPLRALVAHLLKRPAEIEAALSPTERRRWWTWVGGWEALYRWPATASVKGPGIASPRE